jgi:hypothetical protein
MAVRLSALRAGRASYVNVAWPTVAIILNRIIWGSIGLLCTADMVKWFWKPISLYANNQRFKPRTKHHYTERRCLRSFEQSFWLMAMSTNISLSKTYRLWPSLLSSTERTVSDSRKLFRLTVTFSVRPLLKQVHFRQNYDNTKSSPNIALKTRCAS